MTDSLHRELQEHLRVAGVEVIGTQLRRLAYAPEIAGDMLRRQQAEAVVAARSRIVEGAVGMVDMALEMLSKKDIVQLDEERKAAMVSNLLVVLCGESRAQPIVNTGTLHERPVVKRKSFLLRISPELYENLERWAADELRSANAQIEYLLTDAVRRAGRDRRRRPAGPGRAAGPADRG